MAVTAQQLKINQKISQAAVKRSNEANTRLAAIAPQIPLFAVSSGAVGSNLVRGRGAISAQRIDDGNYRVKFDRNISACSWVGHRLERRAPGGGRRDAADRARHHRRGAHADRGAHRQRAPGTPVNSPYQVQVVC